MNEIGERFAFACEHYLKAMIIPGMHFSDLPAESEAELDRIFNNKSEGIKKYSHFFKKLLLEDTILSNELKEQILLGVSLSLSKFKTIQNVYYKNLFTVFTDPKTAILKSQEIDRAVDDSKNTLIEKAKEVIRANDDAYPQSRYGMFTQYVADVEFLYVFSSILRNTISQVFKNCYLGLGTMHIFFDSSSKITVVYENGVSDVFDVDKDGKILPAFIEDIHDICSIDSARPELLAEKIYYKENNTEKVLKIDRTIGRCVSEYNDNELKDKKTRSL